MIFNLVSQLLTPAFQTAYTLTYINSKTNLKGIRYNEKTFNRN
jgi:hypothetical protein